MIYGIEFHFITKLDYLLYQDILPAMTIKKDHIRHFGRTDITASSSREAYASDGSLYRIKPAAVFCPESENETIGIIRRALKEEQAITPRGGGTGLAGGALGRGWVIDCSRLTQVIEISYDQQFVICQPGIIYRDLNLAIAAATPDGHQPLFFSPDPSSGDSCQIGGMLANNSSGPRSIKYGLTSHYVEELTIVNCRGESLTLKKLPLESPELQRFLVRYPEYETILSLLQKNRDIIFKSWPRVKKNSAGYNLHQVVTDLDKGVFNLPALYVGSEGTLGPFLRAKLRLRQFPQDNLSYRLFFGSLESAGQAVAPLLDTEPSVLEIVDGATLNLIDRHHYSIPEEAEAMLLLEYDDDIDRREKVLNKIRHKLSTLGNPEKAASQAQRQELWAARRAIVPTLYRHHSTRRPFAMIEDASLPVEKLAEFIGWIRKRLEKENLVFGLFGHIGDGNLHIRPLLDLKEEKDFDLAQRLYDEVYQKMFELGGSSTAEHADGRLRGPLVKRLYGEKIYSIFKDLKNTLDPKGVFNPDVILTERKFTDDIDYKKLELICAACGKCNGYCPAFEVFRREDMSPRGWLRMLHRAGGEDRSLESVFKYCLNCKNCTTVCPAGVDIAGEILNYKAVNPGRISGSVIGLFDMPSLFGRLLKTGSLLNPITQSKAGRLAGSLAGRWKFGWDLQAEIPQPAGETLRQRHKDLCHSNAKIAFFHGCADNYLKNTAGDALIRVFKHLNLDLSLPPQNCCGLPMEVYGHRDNTIEKARENIDSLESYEAVVFSCASCLHRLADYHELFEEGTEYHQKALALKSRLYEACQYLLHQDLSLPHLDVKQTISYHHPCHLRAAKIENEPLRLLEKVGFELIHPERAGRCCGQAGSFGYLHYREGRAMFSAKKEEYERLGVKTIFSSCPSCISKIKLEMNDDVRVCHPLELVAETLDE